MERQVRYYMPGPGFCPGVFGERLQRLIEEVKQAEGKRGLLFLCIGSDRSTGDSLGPLIGYKLEQQAGPGWQVVGTLEHPVHAINLSETMSSIRRWHSEAVVVAIDASIGQREQVGLISMGKGSLCPGLGVRKRLETVGDIFITGVVGSSACPEPAVLQSIRLGVVMELADAICMGIQSMESPAISVEHFYPNPDPIRQKR